MKKITKYLHDFMVAVTQKYDNKLHIDYYYDERSELYVIWHNNKELEKKNKEFSDFICDTLYTYFYERGINNVTFGYDHFKTIEYTQSLQNYGEISLESMEWVINPNILQTNGVLQGAEKKRSRHKLWIQNDVSDIITNLSNKYDECADIYENILGFNGETKKSDGILRIMFKSIGWFDYKPEIIISGEN
jgi:hypothetical protein